MIATTSLVAGAQLLVEAEAKKKVIQYIKESVIERWSSYRADQFFKTFLEEVRKEKDSRFDSADLNDMLKQVAAGDKQSSAIFDAYRRVALSASKEIGPMIIGTLTASIVLEDRDATNEEELIFHAAEILNDHDFDSMIRWWSKKGASAISGDGALRIFVKKGPTQPPGISLGRVGSGIDDIPLDVRKEIGFLHLNLKI